MSRSKSMPANTSQPESATPPRRRRTGAQQAAALYSRAWPRPLTGCVSALSVCRCTSSDYRHALASYGALRTADDGSLFFDANAHDYDALAKLAASSEGCGCLTVELAEGQPVAIAIGDDEIERCGYLGWLHS